MRSRDGEGPGVKERRKPRECSFLVFRDRSTKTHHKSKERSDGNQRMEKEAEGNETQRSWSRTTFRSTFPADRSGSLVTCITLIMPKEGGTQSTNACPTQGSTSCSETEKKKIWGDLKWDNDDT